MTTGSVPDGDEPDHPAKRPSPLTVQGWHTLVLATMSVLVFSAAIAGGVLLHRSDSVAHQLIAEVQPARSAAYRMQAALRDQEIALRAYAASADPQLLDAYADSKTAESVAAERLRERAGNRPQLIADVDAIEQAADAWRASYGEPLTAGAPRGIDPALANTDVVAFTHLRELFDVQNQHLTDARLSGIADLDRTLLWRNAVLGVIIGILLITAILLAVVMRAAISRPFAALAESCRRITAGNFDEAIVPHGPKDIRGVAVDVEDMRQRVVAALDASRAATARLDAQAVELRRSNAELEQFAYVASHDLQEPLRKVTAFCQLIEKRYSDKLDERGVEYIAFAVDGAKRMQILINDLLSFSRVGRLNAARADVALDSALTAGLANLSTAIAESGAEIVRPTEPLPHVVGDPTLMSMLWQNLVGNAIKFGREGVAPRIVIECGRGETDFEWLFTVSDNGIGIKPEFAEKIFIIFQRLHGRDAYGGTGIGLALCKKIVEYHGGAIWIDASAAAGTEGNQGPTSAADPTTTAGTRFFFTLPVAPIALPHAQTAARKGPSV